MAVTRKAGSNRRVRVQPGAQAIEIGVLGRGRHRTREQQLAEMPRSTTFISTKAFKAAAEQTFITHLSDS